jgi:carbon-monoxide dehydrogenase medium subunit
MNTTFHKPKTLAEALDLLAADAEARPLAGGQTLVPMLNLNLLQPTAIVSLNALEELRGIVAEPAGSVRIGARATASEVAASRAFVAGQRLVPRTAIQIAHPAVRNASTIGGACAHGDSVADWPATLTAVDAAIEIASAAKRRTVRAEDFFRAFLTTALEPGELITGFVIPPLPGNGHYRKFSRVDGDYATVSIAVIVAMEGGKCTFARIAAGSVGPRPVRVPAAEVELIGRPIDLALATRAGELIAAAANPPSDVRGSAAYRLRILPRLVAQTVLECVTNV